MRLTISKFQELYQISTMDIEEIDKSILLVACLTNKEKEEIELMNVDKFNRLCSIINKKIKFDGIVNDNDKPKSIIRKGFKFYYVNYDLSKPPFNSGKYVEIATYSKDIIGNLHNIMATIVIPLKLTWRGFKIDNKKKHKQLAQEMLDIDFNTAYHSAVFFYAVLTKSIQNIPTYLESISSKENLQNLMKNLAEVMGGYITAKWYQNLKI